MKKRSIFALLIALLCLVCVFTLAACGEEPELPEGGDATPHTHSLQYREAAAATCGNPGTIECWVCSECNKIFRDADGKEEVTDAQTLVVAQLDHAFIWKYTDQGHWKSNTCEHPTADTTPVAHTFGENGVCSECGFRAGTNGLEYTLNDDGKSYSVSGTYTRDGLGAIAGDVVIPAWYNGLPVTEIADFAFAGSGEDLTSVVIPSSVTHIGIWAFRKCTALSEIDLPESIARVSRDAFVGCTGIIEVENDISYVDEWVIDANALTTNNGYAHSIRNGTVGVSDYAFNTHPRMNAITIPASLKYIGDHAFEYCRALTSITLPNGLLTIGASAFFACNELVSINIPQSVVNIGSDAFYGCHGVKQTVDGFVFVNDWIVDSDETATALVVPARTAGVADDALSAGPLTESITVESGCHFFEGKNNCLIEKNSKTLVLGCKNSTIPADGSVIKIGDRAFNGCIGLIEITIPASVAKIGDYAFEECTGLTAVTMSEGVTQIGSGAFLGCGALNVINIPEGVTHIGSRAFANCLAVESITIPTTVTTIGTDAFLATSSKNLYIRDLSVWCGINFANSGASPFYPTQNLYVNDVRVVDLVIPNSVTTIKPYAFANAWFERKLTIPNSVTSIGEGAFYGFSVWEGIDLIIPASVSHIDEKAFSEFRGLKSVRFEMGTALSSIGEGAFSSCIDLTEITIPASVTHIKRGAFAECPELRMIKFEEGSLLTDIGESAFIDCASLLDFTIPSLVQVIGQHAFYKCNKLIEVRNLSQLTITAGSEENGRVGYYAKSLYTDSITPSKLFEDANGYWFYVGEDDCYLMSYVGDETVLTLPTNCKGNTYAIYDYAFSKIDDWTSYENNALYFTEITIPEGVTGIGKYAFCMCPSLQKIRIPSSITYVGEKAFAACLELTGVYIHDVAAWCSIDFQDTIYLDGQGYSSGTNPLGLAKNLYLNNVLVTNLQIPSSVTSIRQYAFEGCNITDVELPITLISIGEGAFSKCSALNAITIPSSVTNIDARAFEGSGLESITVENGNPVYHSAGNCLIETESSTLHTGCKNSVIPTNGDVKKIGKYAFAGCAGLTSITIPSSVTHIDAYGFYNCDGLTSMTISENVVSIGAHAFYNCDNLISMIFEVTQGWWYASEEDATTGTSFSENALSNAETAARYWQNLYYNNYWKRS